MSKSGRPRSSHPSGRGYALATFLDEQWPLLAMGTNADVARQLGLHSPNLISHWRTGRSLVSARHLEGLSRLLNVDIGKLLGLWIEQLRRDPSVPKMIADMLVDRLATSNEAVLLKGIRGATSNSDPQFSSDALAEVYRAIGTT